MVACTTYHQLKYSTPNRSNKTKQLSLPSENGGLDQRKTGQGNGPKAEKDKTERATGLG